MTTELQEGDPTMDLRGGVPADPAPELPPEAPAPPGPDAHAPYEAPREPSYEAPREPPYEAPREPPYEAQDPPEPWEGVWRFTAPSVEASVPQARHTVRDLLRRQQAPVEDDIVHGLLLIVSELVTNAVRHAALLSPQIAVEIAIGPTWVRVAVEDNHPYRPKALEADYDGTGGRGLLLVREITVEAGGVCDVEHTAGGGKVVWAALPLKAPAPPAAGGTDFVPGQPAVPDITSPRQPR